ncbi:MULTISPECIES: acyltransferase family protein [unclassified Sphingomonas]|uniref:acyltransferase family protein n=1 Tax=unclassified Sphingomonas TaxID=196159 RepID=UPI0006FDA245|nr:MULTISPECIES: acyltransferase [unclassified Sphingomonas]KQN18897.1 hypothetical protein ASE83_08130 [Sphingomonas sp. Leaf32]
MPVGLGVASSRHYGLDWLRIGAFGVLILYHIAMAFSPWHWVVTTGHAYRALIAPMAAVTPWRLGLLFAVSGYASATLVARAATPAAFAAERSRRLLVPLAFGMLAIVPLEMWVRVAEGGYAHGYLRFWLVDGWRVGMFHGVEFPSWEHLWFVVYLWTYSMLLAAFVATAGAARRMDRIAAWLSRGSRLLWAPIALMAGVRLAALFVVPEGQGLLHDVAGHSQYLPLFALGFLLAHRPALWRSFHRHAHTAMVLALIAGAIVVTVELQYPGDVVPPHLAMAANRAARSVMAWAMVVALFHLADTHANRDHRWRGVLGRAVFPAYIVHHPVIVLVTWFTLPLALGPWTEAALLLSATLIACAAAYLLARALPGLGTLLGVPAPPAAKGGRSPVIC